MATPAQIANDMAAQAAFWEGRDKHVARCCRDAAYLIRAYLSGERVDGRTWGGFHRRALDLERSRLCVSHGVADNIVRARVTLEELRRKANAR